MANKKSETRSNKGDSRQATRPIPVMSEKDANVTTARDFNITGGQEGSDQSTNTGTTDIGAEPSKTKTSSPQPSSVTGGTKVVTDSGMDMSGTEGESSDAGTPAIPTEDSKDTSTKSRTRKPRKK